MSYERQYGNLRQGVEKLLKDMGVDARVDGYGVIQTPNEPLGFERDLGKYIRMGRDFEVLLKAIHANELLLSQWKKLAASIRLTGGDDRGT